MVAVARTVVRHRTAPLVECPVADEATGLARDFPVRGRVRRIRRRRGDRVALGAAVRPGDELVGRAAHGLRGRGVEVSLDADDARHRVRRAHRLAVEPKLETGNVRRQRHGRGARHEVAERAVRKAPAVDDGEVNAVPDVRGDMAGRRHLERATLAAARVGDERVHMRLVMEVDAPREPRPRKCALLRVACPSRHR